MTDESENVLNAARAALLERLTSEEAVGAAVDACSGRIGPIDVSCVLHAVRRHLEGSKVPSPALVADTNAIPDTLTEEMHCRRCQTGRCEHANDTGCLAAAYARGRRGT